MVFPYLWPLTGKRTLTTFWETGFSHGYLAGCSRLVKPSERLAIDNQTGCRKFYTAWKKNLHEWVNDLYSLLWFHGLTQTAFEKLQSFGPNLTLKMKSAKLLRRTKTPQRATNEMQILASWLRTTMRFRKLNLLSTSIFGCPNNFTYVEVRKGRQSKIYLQLMWKYFIYKVVISN